MVHPKKMANINNYQDLKDFLSSKSGLRMAHIYKPVMLLTILRSGGRASKEEIARAFMLSDDKQIDYYKRKIVHPMPGKRLVRDGLVVKDGDIYELTGPISNLSPEQKKEVIEILQNRILDYMEIRNPFGDSNLDPVPGNLRFQVLKNAGNCCELCGISSRETQIDVDHIIPRAKGGPNELWNLQALCRKCNAQKQDRDDTNFAEVHDSYDHREKGCPFCERQKFELPSNKLAFVKMDAFAVTKEHSLIIPRRHVADYFDLYEAERSAMQTLLMEQRKLILQSDESISGFNVGINIGESAGQSIFHVHMHLIPRRDGDVDNPRGGVRHVIPGMGDY